MSSLCKLVFLRHNSCAKTRLFSSVWVSSQQEGFRQLPGNGNPPLPESFCLGAGARLSLPHPEPVSACHLPGPFILFSAGALSVPMSPPQCTSGVHPRAGEGGNSRRAEYKFELEGHSWVISIRVSAVPTSPLLSVHPSCDKTSCFPPSRRGSPQAGELGGAQQAFGAAFTLTPQRRAVSLSPPLLPWPRLAPGRRPYCLQL